MKLAVIAVTNNGARLAKEIAQSFTHYDIFVKSGRNPLGYAQEYDSLGELITKIFSAYDALVFIMATGIVVRVIAPFIRDKRVDPAIVVADESGRHVISLLSGHIGGANELARTIAANIGATAVITTATDVGGQPAADVLAVKAGLKIEPFACLKQINAAAANGEKVRYFLDQALPRRAFYHEQAGRLDIELADMDDIARDCCYDAAVVVTDQCLTIAKPHVMLRPPTLAVGIGCRRGVSEAEITAAVAAACSKAGRSTGSIAVIGSTALKQDETGLLNAARTLGVPIQFYDNSQLAATIEKYQLQVSSFVNDKIGVGNVCEAAAILAGQTSQLLLPKTKFSRVTVAVSRVK